MHLPTLTGSRFAPEIEAVVRVAVDLRLLFAVALAVACGCSSTEEPSDAGTVIVPQEDAAVIIADAATFPDATPVLDCVCDGEEPCQECFEHLGRCCYDDPTIGGRGPLIAQNCETHAACRSCCRECVEASCEELKAQNNCPNIPKN